MKRENAKGVWSKGTESDPYRPKIASWNGEAVTVDWVTMDAGQEQRRICSTIEFGGENLKKYAWEGALLGSKRAI